MVVLGGGAVSYERGTPVTARGGLGLDQVLTKIEDVIKRVTREAGPRRVHLSRGGLIRPEAGLSESGGGSRQEGSTRVLSGSRRICPEAGMQGYLAHKKTPPHRTLQ